MSIGFNKIGRRAIMFFAGGAFETPWYLRGLEQFLVDLRQQPEIAEAISHHVEEYYRRRALRDLAAESLDRFINRLARRGRDRAAVRFFR
jgi:hypothetical protein